MTAAPKPVRLLVELGRPVILQRFRRDSCIASTAIGMKVLRRFGIESSPMPVQMGAYNTTYVEMIEALHGITEEPGPEMQQYWLERGAWAVEVLNEQTEDGNDVGHIVLVTTKHLVDLSLDQASRPHKRIILEPHVCDVPSDFYLGEAFSRVLNDTLVVYKADPGRRAFLGSRDWTDASRHQDAVDEITDLITKQINRRKRR